MFECFGYCQPELTLCCSILSLNPTIDIGQIEGAFVFGLGFNLLEDIVFDKNTGAVLNDGTWVSAYMAGQTLISPAYWQIHLF